MNWLVFALIAWVAAGFEVGLRDLLVLGSGSVAPSFLVIALVFVCLWAKPGPMMLGAALLGLLMDVLRVEPVRETGASLVIVGPYALGAMLAAYTVLTVRNVMERSNFVTVGVMCLITTLLLEIVRLTVLAIRSMYDDVIREAATPAFGTAIGIATYTALAALLLTPMLNRLRKPLGAGSGARSGFVMHR